VIGAATAALLGLVFVAVSIRLETIAKSAEPVPSISFWPLS
jgi:hypothetical protein